MVLGVFRMSGVWQEGGLVVEKAVDESWFEHGHAALCGVLGRFTWFLFTEQNALLEEGGRHGGGRVGAACCRVLYWCETRRDALYVLAP